MTDILLAQRASADDYPPLLNQATILSRVSRVTILHCPPEHTVANGDLALRVEVTAGPVGSRLRRLMSGIYFRRKLRRWLRGKVPFAVIAYEPEAAAVMLRDAKAETTRVVHLHELPVASEYSASRSARNAFAKMADRIRRADLVIVPDYDRATWTRTALSLPSLPTVVMNCPMTLREVPKSRLLPFLESRGVRTRRVVHYQGAVGRDHNLENVVLSMRYWPEDAVFVIVGKSTPEYQEELKQLAASISREQGLIFIGRVPYAEVFSWAVGATVGVTFLEQKKLNWRYAAGASNKRFEYVALGIPQVTNEGPGIRELFVDRGVAAAVDPADVAAIGCSISAFLSDLDLCGKVSVKARELHLAEYNYEKQFEPVLEWLETRVGLGKQDA